MALIKTIEEVQKVMLVSSLDEDNSIPDMQTTQDMRLLKFLGRDFLDELQAVYDVVGYPAGATAAQVKAIEYIQRPLAHFAYLDNLGTIHARITSGGVRSMSSESMPKAVRWEFEEMKQVLAEKAYTSLETLLAFLEDNADDYTTWADDDAYLLRKSMLIKDGGQFADYYSIFQPYRNYYLLLPCMRDVDQLYMLPLLGKDFYDELKALDEDDDRDEILMTQLYHAIANLTIAQACDKLPVRISEHGLTVMQSTGDAGYGNQAAASVAERTNVRDKALLDGKMYLSAARNYLNKNASPDVFATYFSSDNYNDPTMNLFDRKNDQRKIFRF